jgi:hypothetical protein
MRFDLPSQGNSKRVDVGLFSATWECPLFKPKLASAGIIAFLPQERAL